LKANITVAANKMVFSSFGIENDLFSTVCRS
jgi:hypothetical protein